MSRYVIQGCELFSNSLFGQSKAFSWISWQTHTSFCCGFSKNLKFVVMENLQLFKDLALLLTPLITLLTVIIAFREYYRKRKQDKIELFIKYNARFCINEDVMRVTKYLEKYVGLNHHGEVYTPDDHQVEMFMRYFEELEFLIESGAIDEEIVSYMFSYYVFEFEKRKDEWKNVGYEEEGWRVFRNFVNRMHRIKNQS